MQADLSWRTILQKRENHRKTYHRFDPLQKESLQLLQS
ncbi:MAG: DNA-3-methyladenine glycosylase I [Holosporales bacterium]|nr:DNA-3-methyladenine glycosylase I [Holosporales bacterium]